MTRGSSWRGLIALLGSFAAIAAGASLGVSACSSSSDGSPDVGGGAAHDAAVDAVVVDSETRDPDAAIEETASDCLAKCRAAYPSAVALYDAIDVCWGQHCMGPCVDQSGTFDLDGGGDAGLLDGGSSTNDGGTPLCGTVVTSAVDRACDDCTEAFCCPSWKGCYDDSDCLDFNRCVNQCP